MGSINHTAIITTEPIAVWHVLRRFGSIEAWHPGVTRSVIQDGEVSGDGGSVRTLNHTSGEVTQERLLAINNDSMTMTYGLVGSDRPLGNVMATVEIHAMPYSSYSLLHWTVDFDTADERVATTCESEIGEYLLNGLIGLAQHLEAELKVAETVADLEVTCRTPIREAQAA